MNRLQWFDHSVPGQLRGWTDIHVTDGEHPYLGKWWVPGLIIGYEHSFVHQAADFLEGLKTGKPASPTFREALETNKVCDAILKSGRTERWVGV
jgi:predicted dehydrogenase